MTSILWIAFVVFVLVMLTLDLFVVNRKPHVIDTRQALLWTGVCVVMALGFNVLVYFIYEHNWFHIADSYGQVHARGGDEAVGMEAATKFLTGWLVEYSLSLDNIFVIAIIFEHFRVAPKYQHRVLFWGILGALILRGIMIGLGAPIVQHFEWVLYIFGALLIYTGVRLIRQKEETMHPENGIVFRTANRIFPVAKGYEGDRFFVRQHGKYHATILFLVLLVVETTDVVFAVDSIPAIFGITTDPFIVFTSNVFAILGLRSLYFALASLKDKFEYLKFSLAFVLAFVGVKMLLEGVHHLRPITTRWMGDLPPWLAWLPTEQVHVPASLSLSIIGTALVAGVGTSLVLAKKLPPDHHEKAKRGHHGRAKD